MSLQVPYIDLALQSAPIKAELLAAVGQVIDTGEFILGPQVTEFEERFAQSCGVRYALGVNSGTDALILALKALDIGAGDEVITAPNSFVASAAAIQLAGATTILADVGKDYNLDPERVRGAITSKTKAIMPVHLTGRACRMDELMLVAGEHKLHVVEDCAQAVLAEHRGKKVGSFGAIGCFSLHPLKTLNACGDGGVLTTDDAALYERLKIMRNIGLKTRDDCVLWSQNSRLDSVQASMLMVKMKYLEQWTDARRENARRYRDRLRGVSGITLPAEEATHERAVYHTFVVQAERRDELRAHLSLNGIGTSVHYPVPIHLSTAGRTLGYAVGSFPVAEAQAVNIVSLPVYPELTEEKVDWVCDQIKIFYARS